MINLDNQTTLSFDIEVLEKIALTLTDKEIELIITDNLTMKKLNLDHRGKDRSTDVLSFPLESSFLEESLSIIPLGSIVISKSFVTKKAKELEHSIEDELSLLFIHGVLHLLGFNHEIDDGEMRLKEKELIKLFALPKSLIIRTK